MRAASVVGRVGGLAVALGVGAAVATGVAPTAGAETADNPDTSSVSANTQPDTQPAAEPDSAVSTPAAGKKSRAPGGFDLGRTLRKFVDRGVAVGTGGALHGADVDPETAASTGKKRTLTIDVRKPPSKRITAKPEGTADVPMPPARVLAPVTEQTEQADKAEAPARTVVQRAVETIAAARPLVAPPLADAVKVVPAAAPVAVRGVLSNVMAAFGFGPQAGNAPQAPAGAMPALALLAYGSRRELDESFTSGTPQVAEARTAQPLAAAAVTTPVTTRVGWLTGANSINDTVNRFGIAGTDVGVMWDNGVTGDNPATQIIEQREVLIAFGDTFSGPGQTGTWRMNTLFRSPDRVLSDGLYIPDGIIHDPGAYSGSPMTYQNFSREIIGNYHYGTSSEVTMIPTAAVSVPGAGAGGATRQYVQFMAVKSWDTPGRWTTNYSAIAYSDDNGQNWTVVPASSVRAARAGSATVPYVKGNENFQQGAFVKPPDGSPDAAAGWVYSYGTPAGRGGTVYLSRVNQNNILDQTKYEYWNGSAWVKNQPSAAKPVLPGTTTKSFFGLIKTTTYPTAGEMSVQYNPYLKKYVMLYTDQGNNVVMRTADRPEGTWSTPTTLATSAQYPGLYAPMIHPWSGTSQLKKTDGTPEDPQYLYWGLSQWNEYNVALMRTDLSRV